MQNEAQSIDQSRQEIRMTVYAALMAALTAAGAYIAIPIGPVPIVLQNLFVMLAGLLLGWRWGLASIGVYLLAGLLGLPVFAGGTSGIGRFLGPTGGYLIGYLAAAGVIGWISEKGGRRMLFDILAMIAGSLLIYALGVGWLKLISKRTFLEAMSLGMFPFLLGDAIKIAAAAAIARSVRPIMGIARHAVDRD